MATDRDFEPLMNSIERTLAALNNRTDVQELDAAAVELQGLFETYLDCCCRRAHVVKDEGYEAS